MKGTPGGSGSSGTHTSRWNYHLLSPSSLHPSSPSFISVLPRYGHYIYSEVKAIVKSIIGQKRWPSQWSRQLFFFLNFLKSIVKSMHWPYKWPSQLSIQLCNQKISSSPLSSQLFAKKNMNIFVVNYCDFW